MNQQADKTTESLPVEPATIVVVDDEQRIRKVLSLQLEKAGYNVISLDNGKQAMELVGQLEVDVVITDIRMPNVTGDQVLKYVKSHSPTIPVVMLTGVVDVETAVNIMKAGAYDYLVKPVKREELLVTVHRAVQYRNIVLRNIRLQEENIRYQRDLEQKVRERTRELARALAHLREVHMDTVKILASAIEEKDPYMRGHSNRVRILAAEMARRLGYKEMEIERIEYGALLHDIGKIAIDQRILDKPGPLTDEEHKIIQEHPIIGERIIAKVSFFADIAPMVRWHHERWDGLGYPDGIKSDNIPVPVRILNLVDAFDAMTSDRPYRKALPLERVIN
ncbi:two-component system response regulator, partial [bacterium]